MKIITNIRFCIFLIFLLPTHPLVGQPIAEMQKKVYLKSNKIHIDYTFHANELRHRFSSYFSFLHQCGMPSLPIIRDFVIVPKNTHPKFSITVNNKKQFHEILIPQSKPKTIDSDLISDEQCDDSYFSKNQFLPSTNGLLANMLEFSSFNLAFFELYPYQYNPSLKILSEATEISVEIEENRFSNSKSVLSVTPLEYRICNFALNFENIKSQLRLITDTFPNYIIVSHPQLGAAAANLALWKSQQGYKTAVYLNAQWTSDSIRLLMKSVYQNIDSRPSYLCLLGDSAFVPSFQKIAPPPIPDAFATDLYYTTMDSDSDFVANFACGRISVDSPNQALDVIAKLTYFQKFPPFNTSFYSTMVNCSFFQDDDLNGYDDRRFVQTSEEIRTYLQTNYAKNVIRIYEAPEASNPMHWNNDDYDNGSPIPPELLKPTFSWNGNTSDIINRMNQGTFLLLHRDHGYSNASGWAHPSLSSTQLPFLSNDSLLPLIFSINCYSGNFNVPESFAERLLRQNAGASGIFAPSFYSYSGNNDAFALGLYDALFPSPGLFPNFNGTGGNHIDTVPLHPILDKPGDMLRYATWYMNFAWGVDKYSSEIAHFFGDPAMAIQTNVPFLIAAIHSDSVDCVDSVFTVVASNSANFIATITVDDSVISRSLFVNDTALLHFTPQYGNQAVLTISGMGYRPYIRTLNWDCSQPIYPPVARISISDSLICNGIANFIDSSAFFPSSWYWDFGDGSHSTLQNPQHQYNASGIYSVKLKVENNIGSDSILIENAIHAVLPTSIFPIDTSLCHPDWILFQNESIDSLAWYASLLSPVPLWQNALLINVLSDTTVFRSTFLDMPALEVGKLDTSGNGGYIYQNIEHALVFDALADVILNSVDVYALNASVKTIKLLNSENEIVNSKVVALSAGKNTIPLNFIIPQNTNYKLVAPTYCSWYANFNVPYFPYSIPGLIAIDSATNGANYYYFYHWKVQQRCYSAKTSATVHIVPIDSTLSISGNQMLCNGNSIRVFSDSTALSIWNNGVYNSHLDITQPGDYFAQLEKQNCIYTTDTIHVFPYMSIVGDFSAITDSLQVCFQNVSQNAYSYFWDFGDGNFSSEQNPCHQYNSIGQFVTTLTLSNNCDTILVQKTIDVTSIQEENSALNMPKLTPNPASDFVEIRTIDSEKSIQVYVYDMNGQLIQIPYKQFEHKIGIDIRALSNGFYFLKISTMEKNYNFKIIKCKHE